MGAGIYNKRTVYVAIYQEMSKTSHQHQPPRQSQVSGLTLTVKVLGEGLCEAFGEGQ